MATDIAMDSSTFNVHPNNTRIATVTNMMQDIVRMVYRLMRKFRVTRNNTTRAMPMETPMDTRVSCDNEHCRSYNSRSLTNQPFLIPGGASESSFCTHDSTCLKKLSMLENENEYE
jgi:hypothetical protein